MSPSTGINGFHHQLERENLNQVDCKLIQYQEEDAITTYMKHSMVASHLLDYDKGQLIN